MLCLPLLQAAPSIDINNNYAWQEDIAQSYQSGFGMYSSNWQDNTATWAAIPGDFSFQTYMGGAATSIIGGGGSVVTGNVHANTISGLAIGKSAYYQSIQNSTAASYFPNSSDPPPTVLPISDGQIATWQSAAQTTSQFTGDISSCQNIPSGKYIGSVTLNGCSSTMTSPIWITGDLALNNNNLMALDQSAGSNSGVIIVDGKITLGSGNKITGTGRGSSQLILLSTFNSQGSSQPAITLTNSGNNAVLYAGKGSILVANNNTLDQITGWKVQLSSGVTLNYNSGFSSLFFTSGPGGAYSLVKGTYQLK